MYLDSSRVSVKIRTLNFSTCLQLCNLNTDFNAMSFSLWETNYNKEYLEFGWVFYLGAGIMNLLFWVGISERHWVELGPGIMCQGIFTFWTFSYWNLAGYQKIIISELCETVVLTTAAIELAVRKWICCYVTCGFAIFLLEPNI